MACALSKQKISFVWQTTFVPPNPGSDSRVILDENVAEGEHAIPVPGSMPEQAAFASVQVDSAVYTFRLANDTEHKNT